MPHYAQHVNSRCACIGIVHIYVLLSQLWSAKRSVHESKVAKQWSLNAAAAAVIATLLGVQQPSFVLHPALTCTR